MTQEPQNEDLIRYDVMVQDALLGVVRKVLIEASRSGLPGEHHFYITFRSHAPGVRLSNRLKEKHPEEMTIVLQHQFWDMLVTETSLEVGLSFGGVPEKLFIPFDAMTGFYDPSVQFGLKFAADEAQADNDLNDDEDASVKDRLAAITEHESTKKGKSKLKAVPTDEPAEALAPVKKLRSSKAKTTLPAVATPEAPTEPTPPDDARLP